MPSGRLEVHKDGTVISTWEYPDHRGPATGLEEFLDNARLLNKLDSTVKMFMVSYEEMPLCG